MASFLVFLSSARPVLVADLVHELTRRELSCRFEPEGVPPYIEFVGKSKVLFLKLHQGEVPRAELDPEYAAQRVDERIMDVLIDFEYELLDDDDPRIEDDWVPI